MGDSIQLFENQPIRTAWDEEKEEWYFSVVDAVGILTDQPDARHASTYWAVLKKHLKNEGADQLLTNCKQLRMTAADGKKRIPQILPCIATMLIYVACGNEPIERTMTAKGGFCHVK